MILIIILSASRNPRLTPSFDLTVDEKASSLVISFYNRIFDHCSQWKRGNIFLAMKNILTMILLLIGACSAQEKYKICATENIQESTCNALQRSRSESQVSCLRVTDSAECAIRMAEGKADFGIFSAEEMLLAYQFYPEELQPIIQLRHPDRLMEDFDFQSVAIVPAGFDNRNGLAALKNGGFCHPGFSETQNWNDYVMKYFEKKVYDFWCRSDLTASENEAENLKNFFGTMCRPGEWVPDWNADKILKMKYPELCRLCDDHLRCEYRNNTNHRHFGALDCLVSGRGKVAYVAYEYVRQYFNLNGSTSLEAMQVKPGFQFLCPDGTTRPLTSSDPCAWIRQPWSTVLARKDKASGLLANLKNWLVTARGQHWTVTLDSTIQADGKAIYLSEETDLRTYLVSGREVEIANITCGQPIRWCTVNPAEHNKCQWVVKEVLALGIQPSFSCIMTNSTFECLKYIANKKADIITIDSNYGHIARKVFNLTTTMYAETDHSKNSEVIAIVRNTPGAVSSFKNLKGKKACFPEYGGIAWLSFLNTIRTKKLIADTCDYPELVAEFLSGGCAPGIKDSEHKIDSTSSKASFVLCSACPMEKTNVTCTASHDNDYYGDKGALKCLMDKEGDIAFVEAKNLQGYIDRNRINPDEFRVLCKNGSLATYTGFTVDETCALSSTIDSEVVSRRDNSEVFMTDVVSALQKIEDWLGYRADSLRPIKIYDSFSGDADLLFKDSTVGLVTTTSEIKSVLAYKELFSHVESCSGVGIIVANIFTIFSMLSIIFTAFH